MEREGIIPQLDKYVELVQQKANDYWKLMGFTFADPPHIDVMWGKKYARIVKNDGLNGSRSVHTFVNMTNGDILKSGSWKAPAPNGVRGNIFANDFGADRINEFGATYLKGPQF